LRTVILALLLHTLLLCSVYSLNQTGICTIPSEAAQMANIYFKFQNRI
jgi:hypothetical protein